MTVPRAERARKQRWRVWLPVALVVLWAALTALQWRLFGGAGSGRLLETVAVFSLVNLNILLLLLLLFLALRNLAKLLFERRAGVPGARLKTKLVCAFLAMTVIPTGLLYLASAGFLTRSIDTWFSARVEGALRQALEVARSSYGVEEQRLLSRAQRVAEVLSSGPATARSQGLQGALGGAGEGLRLEAVTLLDAAGQVLEEARTPAGEALPAVVRGAGEVAAALDGRSVASLLRGPGGYFLRSAVPTVMGGALVVDATLAGGALETLREIADGFEEYRQLQVLRAPIKASYMLPLAMVALMIVFAATWFGFLLARGITGPIQGLAAATQRVAGGDLDFQLEVISRDEIGTLVASFNRMTRDLRNSKAEVEAAEGTLLRANAELEQRRRYMEIVLGRVAAGVVSADREGRITTLNAAAEEMLGIDRDAVGRPYGEVLPLAAEANVSSMLAELRQSGLDSIQRQVLLEVGGQRRTLVLNLTTLRDEAGATLGTVAVFDDLTELVKAQRAQAWQEVARRIAHEVKNPLTPIQLSAQRLRRRYAGLLGQADGEVFDEATRTIVEQVDGLKRLVDEFSRFAKLPETRPSLEDLNGLVGDVLALYRPAHPDICFRVDLEEALPACELDADQVKRALLNLLDNAVAAVAGRAGGRVAVATGLDPERRVLRVVVADNGPGLSPLARERIFEPYFSTKRGGTGLGLAIVKSIVADHRGYVRALDNRPQGAQFVLEFPLPGETP